MELLEKATGKKIEYDQILGDDDLKKIRLLKKREALKTFKTEVDKEKEEDKEEEDVEGDLEEEEEDMDGDEEDMEGEEEEIDDD